MDLNSRSLLAIGLDPDVLMRILPLLWKGPFDVSTPATPLLALGAIDKRSFRLIVSAYPVAGVSFDELVDRVRALGGPCRAAGLVAVAPPEHLDEARRFLGRGVSRVVSNAASDAELEASIADLLDIAPRAHSALTLDLKVRQNGCSCSLMTQTVNLSRSGMLARSGRTLEVGAPVDFNLQLPSGLEVHGEGEIMRRTNPRRERVDGVGIRFTIFQGQGSGLLKHFLANAFEAEMAVSGRGSQS